MTKINFSAEIDKTLNTNVGAKKRKAGRPKSNKPTRVMTVNCPIDLYEGVKVASKLLFRGNKSKYINTLIEKDLKENLEKYKEFANFKSN